MKIVSDNYSNVVKIGGEKVTIPPGIAFDCPKKAALEKIKAGRARKANARDGAVATEAVTEPDPSGDNRSDDIQTAIIALDEEDESLWLDNGKPRTEALAAVLDGPVSAAERDEAWEALNAEPEEE